MSVRSLVCLLGAILLVPGTAQTQDTLPIPVFVTHIETPALPPLKPEQHAAVIQRTRTEMMDLAVRVRKQHGDKTSAWAPEVWAMLDAAEDQHTLAIARRDYQSADTKLGLRDSVADFVRSASRSKVMTMAPSADEASLLVQITGRRRISRTDPLENGYFIRFRLAPGPRMSADRFIELTRGYKWNGAFSKLVARADGAAAYVDLEAASPVGWRNCADSLHAMVGFFIRERLDPAKKK